MAGPDTNPPVAKQVPHTWKRPTGEVDDPWAWLRDRDDPDTIAYLEAENAHTDAWFAQRADTVEELFQEIRSRVQETDVSAPVPHHGWYYSARTVEGQAYPIHCRGRSAETADAEVVLDQNAEAAGHEYFDLGALEINPDHTAAAWSGDTRGDEHYTLRFRDLATGTDLDDVLHDTTWAGVAWSRDGQYVFYVTADEQERPFEVWRHRVGTSQDDDVKLLTELDERFFVGLGATRSDDWIIIHTASKLSAEAWLVPADDPTADPVLVMPRRDDVEYSIDHWGDRFVVLTNLDATDFRVMTAPLDRPGEWSELIPHEPGRRITSIEPFATHLAVHEWCDAQPRIRIVFRDGSERLVSLAAAHGEEPHDIEFGANAEWDTTQLRVSYQSFTTPLTVHDVDVHT
ncbi:MAG TPA: hypothetical protein VGK49_03120, partial [Ilumatobacteraceae bacterium]